MALGPGKYDAECTQVRESTGAPCVVVIVIGGKKGGGFSMQATPEYTMLLPELLRITAREIEKSGGTT